MKKALLYICIFLFSVSLYSAEPLVKFYLKDGNTKEYNVTDLQKINFLKSNLGYTMLLYYPDSKPNNVDLRVVDSISFVNNDLFLSIGGKLFNWCKLSQIDSIIFVWNTCKEITIGSQTWMCHNLDVDHYHNGDPIPEVNDPDEWKNLKTGAWCYYNNDPATDAVYGKLYNWYAVNDPRGIAPDSFKIPSDGDWNTLSTFLGGDNESGAKLKNTGNLDDGDGLWESPNEATNESGFSAVPAGYRHYWDGAFDHLANGGYWWTSSASTADGAWARLLLNYAVNLTGRAYEKTYGFSVRCLRR